MAHPSGPADSKAADDLGIDRDPLSTHRPRTSASDVIPIGPNLFATLASFVALSVAPRICLHILDGLWEDAIGEDHVATLFVLANLEETLVIAAVGALFFLVIGIILQAWWHHRPFELRRPILLAFPIAWALIMPESLWRGGSLVSGALIGSAVALAFAVHWEMLVFLNESMD
jgi:hypothetical protein